MDMALIRNLMERSMSENGETTKKKEKDNSHGLMAKSFMATLRITIGKGSAF